MTRMRPSTEDSGFTLIEVIVALTIFAIVAIGVLPLLITSARATQTAKLNTQAKNISEQAVEQMRDLSFHVDRQNGPFVDLLDQYYTDCTPYSTSASGGRGWASTSAAVGQPATGSFYRVVTTGISVGRSTFSQEIDTQFLTNSTIRTPVATSRICPTAVTSGPYPGDDYSSQYIGRDQPVSQLVGVTVITSWTTYGSSKSSRVYTEIADQRSKGSLVTAEAHASFLKVNSTSYDGSALLSEVGVVDGLGSLSTGSVASVHAQGGYAKLTTSLAQVSNWASTPADATAPPNPTAAAASNSANTAGYVANPDASTCGFASMGPVTTRYTDATTAAGLPAVPSNAGQPGWQPVSSALSGSGNASSSCGAYWFTNQTVGGPAPAQPLLPVGVVQPIVAVGDVGNGAALLVARAGLYASPPDAAGQTSVTSVTSLDGSAALVKLFPGVTTVTDGGGVVDVRVTSASLTCSSGNVATATYTVVVDYWTSGGRVTLPATTFTSGSSFTDPLASRPPSTIQVAPGVPLSSYLQSWSLASAVTEGATNGVKSLNGIVSLVTAPTRTGDPTSAVNLSLGRLSCVADDNR